MKENPRNGSNGHAAVEIALMMPLIFFLFMAILDFGFYAYTAISVENAARVAALYATTSGPGGVTDSGTACQYVLQELRNAANVSTTVTSCPLQPTTPTQAA